MKYVNITDEAVVLTLKCAKHYGSLRCIRERAHGLLLSNRGFTLEQIAEILEIKYQTAFQWIDDWEDYGIRALYKRHGDGRPCIYDESEVQRIKELVMTATPWLWWTMPVFIPAKSFVPESPTGSLRKSY